MKSRDPKISFGLRPKGRDHMFRLSHRHFEEVCDSHLGECEDLESYLTRDGLSSVW